MSCKWQKMTLMEAGVMLIDCDHKTPKSQETGRPYIGIPQLKDCRITLEGARLISEEDYIHWRRKAKPQEHDVILSRRCNPGHIGYVTGDLEIALGQNLVLLRADGKIIYPPFLRWLTQGKYWWNQVNYFINVGAVFESLKCADIPKFEVLIPSIEEQKILTACMSTIDDKISLNLQTNQTLEEIAQAIFKSWFVDFDPVKAKMLGEQPEGMDAATVALFPDKLVESELGLIPEGWEVKPLDKIAEFQNGLALQKFRPESDEDEFLPVLKIAQLRQGYCDGKERARADIKESCRVYDGDVIFSWSGSLMVDLWTGGNAALNQHLFKVTSKEYSLPMYLYWTKHHLASFQQIAKDKAVTMGHIKRSHLSESMCLIPPKGLQSKFDKILLPLIEQCINLRLQNNKLSKLRDTLLPKLLSGEVTLAELEVQGE